MTDTTAPPRRTTHPRDVAMRLAADEYRRWADAVAALGDDDWARPTDCTLWNVKQLVAHMVGMPLMAASPLQMIKQQLAAKRRQTPGTPQIDALTAVQVDLFQDKPTSELVRLSAWVGPRAAKGRRRMPGVLRRRPMPEKQRVNGVDETWTLGYATDTILTRDAWMHRIDLTRATGRELVLTPEHDGAIVADVVAEWAERHGQPYRLTLTGPAGGTFASGEGSEEITMDAVEFCRVLGGRAPGTGLLETEVPF